MMAASVEDFPEPVGPVTSTIPLSRSTILANSAGKLSDSNEGTLKGITRITIAQAPRCMKILTRNRFAPGKLYDTSQDPRSFKLSSACWLVPISSKASRRVSSIFKARAIPAGASLPLISTIGGLPGVKKRSLILVPVLSIAASNAGVEKGAGAGAAAAPAPAARGTVGATFGTPFGGEDGEDILFVSLSWCR